MKSALAVTALLVVGVLVGLYVRLHRNDAGEYHPPGKLERKIAARIDRCQSSQSCEFRLSELTDFEWDRAFIFPAGTTRQEIETKLHASFPQQVDTMPLLVFMEDGRVVYEEEEAWHAEKAAVNGVTFDPATGERESEYDPNTMFSGTRTSYESGYLYSLKSLR